MPNDLDKLINDLTEQFRQELLTLKEEEFDDDFLQFLKTELKCQFGIAKEKEVEKKLIEEIKEELKKCEDQDEEISLQIKVDLIQTLIYQILVERKFDISI